MKKLIIAEKPSVAKDIASVLGVNWQDGVYENDQLIISNCIGHLIELDVPELKEQGVKLPILPKKFDLSVKPQTKTQFNVLSQLMKRPDVGVVINACDAGREGELIFRWVYEKIGATKPMERMWLQSMTDDAINYAFEHRTLSKMYDALADAAKCRAESDWLYGINGSRVVKSAVGRVMTPTLAMVTDRFLANKNFIPKTFYEVVGTFKVKNGTYEGKLQTAEKGDLKLDDKREAENQVAYFTKLVASQSPSITEETTLSKKQPPLLFHLTSLQQVANKQFGLSASETLTIAQALYEKHKMITYPRTDADALPTDYVEKVKSTLLKLVTAYAAIKPILEQDSVKVNNTRIFNNSKISDHFAIIPTGILTDALSEKEELIYDLIVKRFIAAFYPSAEYLKTVRYTTFSEGNFKSTGSVLKNAGWLAVYNNQDDDVSDPKLPLLQDNEKTPLSCVFNVNEGVTKPPALYTEATLLKAMETAGKHIEDEAIATALKDKGLGTPATRAAIIEKLKTSKNGAYIKQDKKSLIPTEKGIQLIATLRDHYPAITSAELTGEWESKLKTVEKGGQSRNDFMREIEQEVFNFVKAFKDLPPASSNLYASIGKCPVCGGADLINRKFSHFCGNCEFNLNKQISGLTLKDKDIKELLSTGKTKKLKGFKSKAGKVFEAVLTINKIDKKVEFDFGK